VDLQGGDEKEGEVQIIGEREDEEEDDEADENEEEDIEDDDY